MDDFLERIIKGKELPALFEEVGFAPIERVLIWEHMDDIMPNHEQRTEGRLATALLLFDHLLDGCKSGQCPEFKKEWCPVLDDLSIARCIEMKAYHIWRHNGRPFQSNPDQRKADYISAYEGIWAISSCPDTMKQDLVLLIHDFYVDRHSDMKNKKAHWQSQTRINALPQDHYCDACGYVESFYSFLNGESQPDEPKEFVEANGSMMSVLEFLLLACKCPFKSATYL